LLIDVAIPATELDAAATAVENLVAFSARCNVSLDWLVLGDLKPTLRGLYRQHRAVACR
jgi:hypothetical protein